MWRGLMVVAAFAFAAEAAAQTPSPTQPPDSPALVAITPPSVPFPAFLDLAHLERDSAQGLARFWVFNVIPGRTPADNGAYASGSWARFEIMCDGSQYVRLGAVWIDENGAVVQLVPRGEPHPGVVHGSAMEVAQSAACNGVTPSGAPVSSATDAIVQTLAARH